MDPLLWGQLLLQFILILVNAFFASTEMAVVSLNGNKIRKLAEDGDASAKKLLRMVDNPDSFLSTIQIGITLAGFLGSAFAADNFASRLCSWLVDDLKVTVISPDVLNTIAVILITILLSFFTLVLGELVPKRIAMKKPEKVARAACGVVRFVGFIVSPIIWLLSISTNAILYLIGIDPHSVEDKVTEEEIRLMVDVGEETGTIEANEKEMIENIFEFNNITAADVMTHRMEMTSIWVEDPDDVIIQTIQESGFSRFPVYDEDIDNIIGILSTRQFLLNLHSKNPLPLREILYKPHLVPETVRADLLFNDMQKNKIHMAVVLDEYGGTSGVVTMEDLIEEIVGNIYDESDDETSESKFEKIGEDTWRMSGSIELGEIEKELDINFDEEDDNFDTLSGLIFSRFTVIPGDGETPELDVPFMHVKVESIVDHRVEWAIITKVLPTAEDDEAENDKE